MNALYIEGRRSGYAPDDCGKTLKDAGISDTDKGVLIQMEDGSEFQLIIKQTAKYDPAYYERPDTPIH